MMSDVATPVPVTGADAIVRLLHENGYKAQHVGEGLVRSGTSGVAFLVKKTGDGWLQFAMSLRSGGEIDLMSVNEFNRKYRYCRVYLDQESDLVLESDFLLEREDDIELFKRYINLWDDLISLLLTFARDKQRLAALAVSA